ncbi:MAG: hypothetical protein KBA03_04290 [Anaerolineaceae bacterium]|nr:hypothetical protein [Anaerolineaceae bacterium]
MHRRESQKTSNIVRALCQYFLLRGGYETHIVVQPCEDYSLIEISGRVNISEQEIQKIEKAFNQTKTSEMEYYYDDLLSTDLEDNELDLLGQTIDDHSVTFADGLLKIVVKRYYREN